MQLKIFGSCSRTTLDSDVKGEGERNNILTHYP